VRKTLLLAVTGLAVASLATSAHAGIIDFSTMTLNGFATATPTALRLTDGPNLLDPGNPNSNIGEASSAFITTAFSSNIRFSSSFTFTLTNTGYDPQGDGITFLVQNDPAGAAAVGGGGGGVGANGLASNIGVGFQSWDNDHASIFTDGSIAGGPIHNYSLGGQNDVVAVTVGYDGTTFSYTAFNHATGLSIADSQAFDLTSLGPTVYIGFTGATGLSHADQQITNWDLTVRAPETGGVPEPASWALMIAGFGLAGTALRRRGLAAAPA
jgi:hypothetical protein